MTVAADTRAAVRDHPFLETALRAGVVNYTAAARFLEEQADGPIGEREAVAAALRRYAEEVDDYEAPERRASVSMRSGIERVEGSEEALLAVGDDSFVASGGDSTAVIASGDIGAAELADALGRLRTAGVEIEAAAGTDGELVVVVRRRDGADAVRALEAAL